MCLFPLSWILEATAQDPFRISYHLVSVGDPLPELIPIAVAVIQCGKETTLPQHLGVLFSGGESVQDMFGVTSRVS